MECRRVTAVAVEVALDSLGVMLTRWDDAEVDLVRFEEYFSDAASADVRATQMTRVLASWSEASGCAIEVAELLDRDWQEAWKATIHAARVSDRVVIKPSWEKWDTQPDDCVIEIDPGMSFGTGLHFTTRSCLRFLDRLLRAHPVDRFCDLGCGSGILSIAAIKLGVSAATAFDIDDDAVRITAENCERNGVVGRVCVRRAALAALGPIDSCPLVAANILAHVLREEIDLIATTVAPGGHLMLAGTTEGDFAAVSALYTARGFECIADEGDGEWRSGLYRQVGAAKK